MTCSLHATYHPQCGVCIALTLATFDDAERAATAIPCELED
jgi:hypothetical protein